jgi:hypothetical protein
MGRTWGQMVDVSHQFDLVFGDIEAIGLKELFNGEHFICLLKYRNARIMTCPYFGSGEFLKSVVPEHPETPDRSLHRRGWSSRELTGALFRGC